MLKFTIEPYDVLFFGSGKPFNIGSNVKSIFPPFPHSFAAAVYAKFVAEKGNTIQNDKGIYKAVYGPFIEKNGIIYFPTPCDILKEKKKEDFENIGVARRYEQNQFKLINIGDTDLENKINSLIWAEPEQGESHDFEVFKGFISVEGLKKWYNGENIDKEDLLKFTDVFVRDERVSIRIDHATGTVQSEDGLYRVNYLQLKKDIKFVFWVEPDFGDNSLLREKNVENEKKFKEIFEKQPVVLKLGGETKTAKYSVEINDFKDLFNGFNKGNSEIKIILFLTQGIFYQRENTSQNRNNILDYFNSFLTGVIDGYFICGINSKYNKDKYGKKTIRAIKPGSVVYLKDNLYTNDIITFLNQNDSFIGSNLVLIK